MPLGQLLSRSIAGNGYQVFDWSDDASLSNSGERVALVDTYKQVADEVTYGTAAPWPDGPNNNGPSLSLLDLASDTSLPESWAASSAAGGTPGAANFPAEP